jgi:hypothetical protein
VALAGREPHQFADHGHRQRQGEVLHEVGVITFGQGVDQGVGDPGHGRAHLPDLARGERPVDQLPQPGVVRRVAVEHVHDLDADPCAADPAVLDLPGPPGVLAQPRVGERAAHVVVPGDQVHRQALVVGHHRHRCGLAQLGEGRVGILGQRTLWGAGRTARGQGTPQGR